MEPDYKWTPKDLCLVTFDTALPQDWVDWFAELTGYAAFGEFVWCYDGSILGFSVPLSIQALKLMLIAERRSEVANRP
jgi:hypothetical protein